MPESAVLTQPPPVSPPASLPVRALRTIPGMLLLLVVGYGGKVIEEVVDHLSKVYHLRLPTGEYILWAIMLGMIIANTTGVPEIFRSGVATYEFWLKLGIVLLGARFVLSDLLRLGGISLILVVFEIGFSLVFMTMLGRWFKLRPKLISLLAIGSSICGVSAILASCGVIGADDEDTSYAIAAILALGAISLVAFPLVGHSLHLSDHAYGLWAGLAVDNTAEATAAGAIYSDAAGKVAVLAKTCRSTMLGFVVLAYAVYWATKGEARVVTNKAKFLWQKFPKFVLGFLAISVLASFHYFSPAQTDSIANLSRWVFLLSFAGVGFRTNLRELGKQGARPFVVGLVGEIAIAAITLGLVYTAGRFSTL
jgi:uncharacterized integral membrane protein (TIGR00698 family)